MIQQEATQGLIHVRNAALRDVLMGVLHALIHMPGGLLMPSEFHGFDVQRIGESGRVAMAHC